MIATIRATDEALAKCVAPDMDFLRHCVDCLAKLLAKHYNKKTDAIEQSIILGKERKLGVEV